MGNLLDEKTRRQVAVKADVDPRTVEKVLREERVRGPAGERAKKTLLKLGLLSERRDNNK